MSEDVAEYFRVRLLIKHPSLRSESISKEIGYEPDIFWNDGEQIVTPRGRVLDGVRKGTMWSKSYQFYGRKDVLGGVNEVVLSLTVLPGFLEGAKSTGGSFQVIADIFGSNNIGDTMSCEKMERLAKVGFDFGIEIFPAGGDIDERLDRRVTA